MTNNSETNAKSKKDELPKDVLDLVMAIEALPAEHRMILKPVVDSRCREHETSSPNPITRSRGFKPTATRHEIPRLRFGSDSP